MDNPGNSRTTSRDQKCANSRTRQSTKLRDILKCENPVKTDLSYADFHHEITKRPDITLPKYVYSQQSQVFDRSISKEDELVRYMSNLPNYLEKGQNFQGKALNFGVLDWNQLEKWQSNQKQTPQQIGCSPASTKSSLFSSEGSSSHSSKGTLEESRKEAHIRDAKSISGSGQRMLPRVPQYHSRKVIQGGFSPNIEVYGEIPQKFQDSPVNTGNNLRVFDSNLKSVSGKEKRQEKSKTQGIKSATIRSQETNKHCSLREKSGDVLMSTKLSKDICSSSNSISSFIVDGRLSVDPCHRSILGRNNLEIDHEKQLNPSESSFKHEIVVKNSSKHTNSCKNNTQGTKSDTRVQVSEELGARRRSTSVPKPRNPSPIRKLGCAMGKIIKSTGSRDNSPVHRSNSKECVTKSRSEKLVSSIENPYYDNKLSDNNNRGRSSPLRRFLDPLLKPRASNFSESSKKISSSTLLQAQALLQVSFRNGIPLFTFAIDNETDILAATMKKSSVPGKGNHSWIYTFFNIREVKKRSGLWLTQGGKGKGNDHGYTPNVVAQMKVSDYHITREFNLFAVDGGDQYANELHPTNELAAIVVKLSRNTLENDGNDRNDGDEYSCNWLEMEDEFSVKSQSFRSTVILPGGVHTVPSKGELSTLAERWRSGGLCDCGGWDLGCQLRVYTTRKEHERRSDSCGSSVNKDKFQLFSQGNQDTQPILSLSPFKERLYSVEFNSSLSLLQAFAICTSFIDCRRPLEHPEPSISIEKITDECVFEVFMRSKTSNQGEIPANYFSNPPHSPVGRV